MRMQILTSCEWKLLKNNSCSSLETFYCHGAQSLSLRLDELCGAGPQTGSSPMCQHQPRAWYSPLPVLSAGIGPWDPALLPPPPPHQDWGPKGASSSLIPALGPSTASCARIGAWGLALHMPSLVHWDWAHSPTWSTWESWRVRKFGSKDMVPPLPCCRISGPMESPKGQIWPSGQGLSPHALKNCSVSWEMYSVYSIHCIVYTEQNARWWLFTLEWILDYSWLV